MGGKVSSRNTESREYLEQLHKQVPNMNLEDVLEIYKDFNRFSGKNGKLTKSSFRKVYKQAFGESAKELSDAIFQSFDTDGNGKIDFEEFLVGLSMSDSNGNDRRSRIQKLRWAFNVYDKDRSGTIDKKEMVSIVKVRLVTHLFFALRPSLTISPLVGITFAISFGTKPRGYKSVQLN